MGALSAAFDAGAVSAAKFFLISAADAFPIDLKTVDKRSVLMEPYGGNSVFNFSPFSVQSPGQGDERSNASLANPARNEERERDGNDLNRSITRRMPNRFENWTNARVDQQDCWMSPDQKTIYFGSWENGRPNGLGILKIKKLIQGKWIDVESAGRWQEGKEEGEFKISTPESFANVTYINGVMQNQFKFVRNNVIKADVNVVLAYADTGLVGAKVLVNDGANAWKEISPAPEKKKESIGREPSRSAYTERLQTITGKRDRPKWEFQMVPITKIIPKPEINFSERQMVANLRCTYGFYTGEMMNGKPHGTGAYHFDSGISCTGAFWDGSPHGYVKIQYPQGETYKGYVNKKCQAHGQGVYIGKAFAYDGEWCEGVKTGSGVITCLDGSAYRVVHEGERIVSYVPIVRQPSLIIREIINDDSPATITSSATSAERELGPPLTVDRENTQTPLLEQESAIPNLTTDLANDTAVVPSVYEEMKLADFINAVAESELIHSFFNEFDAWVPSRKK